MAGPSYTGVRTVIDPFEGLQKAVSNAGDIYREYEKSSREADVHNAKMQEVERVKFQRDFLKNYDPQLGVQGKGLSDDAKKAAQAEEERVVQHFAEAAARGEEVPSPEELRKQISATYGQLATQESAQQAIMKDLLPYFDPAEAATYAQSLTGGLVSRASLQEQEKAIADAKREHYRDIREAGKNTLEAQARQITANAAVLRAENAAQDRLLRLFASGGLAGSKSAPKEKWQDTEAFQKGLDDAVGGWPLNIDGKAALDVVHRGLDAYNAERRAAGKPELPKSEAYNYAYESIGRDWLVGRDIEAQTPGEFQVALKERFDKNPEAFRQGLYRLGGSVGSDGAGSSVLTELDKNSANMLRNVVLVQPRSMTEIEKARVQEAFKNYIPRPETATQSTGTAATTTPAGGTTTASQQGSGEASGKKSGAELAAEAEASIKRAEELRAEQDKAAAEKAAAAKDAEATRAITDRPFLADTSLPAGERVRMLRDNIVASDKAQREEAVEKLALERDHILAAIEKNAQRMEARRAKEEEGGRHNNPMTMNVLSDEDARLSTQLGRLNREISEIENQTVDTNRPIEELLPRDIPDLEKETGVRPRAAEISRGLLEEYDSVAAPSRNGRQRSKLFQDRVDQTAQYIAETDPSLAEEVRRAAVFGKEYIDNRLRLVEDARIERLLLNSSREDLERELSEITIPEAGYGIQQRIDNIRKQLEFLR